MIERFIVEVEHSRVTSHKEAFQGAFRFYLFDLEVIKIKNAMQVQAYGTTIASIRFLDSQMNSFFQGVPGYGISSGPGGSGSSAVYYGHSYR